VFTVRYVEGELLYYTRDDSVFRRHRRVIGLALAADLDDARVKDRDMPWQRLIVALGLVVAAIRWLTEQLGDHALTIRVGFPPGQLAEEREIVALLLSGEIQRGLVVVEEASPDAIVAATVAQNTSAVADVVSMALGPPPAIPKGLRAIHMDLAGRAPVIGSGAVDSGADAWSEWCDAAEDLLRWLV
jgi:hypothetical protein